MNILRIFTRMTEQAKLMDTMMEKLDVADDIRALPDNAAVLRRAATRCLNCGQPDACADWLSHTSNPDAAPSFCRNHDLFERIITAKTADCYCIIP